MVIIFDFLKFLLSTYLYLISMKDKILNTKS